MKNVVKGAAMALFMATSAGQADAGVVWSKPADRPANKDSHACLQHSPTDAVKPGKLRVAEIETPAGGRIQVLFTSYQEGECTGRVNYRKDARKVHSGPADAIVHQERRTP